MKTHSEAIDFLPCVINIKAELNLHGFYNNAFIDWLTITDYYVNALVQDPTYLVLTDNPLEEVLRNNMVTDVANSVLDLARGAYWEMLYRNVDNDLAILLKEKRPGVYASARLMGSHNYLIDIIYDVAEEAEWLCGVNQNLLK